MDRSESSRCSAAHWLADGGLGYENGDPYVEFLPPALVATKDGESEYMRAVVIITENTTKGTARSGQEYVNPLLTLSGREYGTHTTNTDSSQIRRSSF